MANWLKRAAYRGGGHIARLPAQLVSYCAVSIHPYCSLTGTAYYIASSSSAFAVFSANVDNMSGFCVENKTLYIVRRENCESHSRNKIPAVVPL